MSNVIRASDTPIDMDVDCGIPLNPTGLVMWRCANDYPPDSGLTEDAKVGGLRLGESTPVMLCGDVLNVQMVVDDGKVREFDVLIGPRGVSIYIEQSSVSVRFALRDGRHRFPGGIYKLKSLQNMADALPKTFAQEMALLKAKKSETSDAKPSGSSPVVEPTNLLELTTPLQIRDVQIIQMFPGLRIPSRSPLAFQWVPILTTVGVQVKGWELRLQGNIQRAIYAPRLNESAVEMCFGIGEKGARVFYEAEETPGLLMPYSVDGRDTLPPGAYVALLPYDGEPLVTDKDSPHKE